MKYFEPWVVLPDLGAAYKQVAKDVYVLEERITPEVHDALPETVRALYKPVYNAPDAVIAEGVRRPSYADAPMFFEDARPHAYWLRVEDAPESERVRWRTFLEEANLHEADALMEEIELYTWVPAKIRFVLRDMAWREAV